MKSVIKIVVAAGMLSGGLVMAQQACCAGPKGEAKACSAGAVSNLVAKLSLSDEQAAKLQQTCAKYSQGERNAATASNCMAEVMQLLTPEQAAKFKVMCQAQGGCPAKPAK